MRFWTRATPEQVETRFGVSTRDACADETNYQREDKMSDETVELWICVDCAMLAANGEYPPEATPEECDKLLSLAEGSIVVGDDTREFSWSRCDGCGSHLGGARLQAYDFILAS